jgi:hypothetical protein
VGAYSTVQPHNSVDDVIPVYQNSMAQSRTDIQFRDLNRGFQIGINNGPIHLPPGTSAKHMSDSANCDLPHQSDPRHHSVRRLPFLSSAILITSIDRLCSSRSAKNVLYLRHMIQQFLQDQLKFQRREARRAVALTVSRCFGKGHTTTQNIVKWENS